MQKQLMVLICAVAAAIVGTLHAQEAAPAEAPLNIQVNRDAGKMGSLCVTKLYIDGNLVAQLAPGQSATFTAPTGAKELMARPALDSYLCRKFYSAAQFEIRAPLIGVTGPSISYRYGFTGKGVPFIEPSGP